MEHVTSRDFGAKVLQSDKTVIVDFYADWCGPCRQLAPVFEELAQDMPKASFVKVNVEDAPDVAAQYQVRSIPTLIIFKEGAAVDRITGFLPKEALRKAVETHQ